LSEPETGLIVATYGRHYLVRSPAGVTVPCVTRGKKGGAACGDQVQYHAVADDQGMIDTILPRRNLFYRSDGIRRKVLAANLSQVAIVLATEPPFSDDLLSRALIATEALSLAALIILNKIDLEASVAAARARLLSYAALGYRVLEISVKSAPKEARALLIPALAEHSTLLLGQSGMGKSTLLNILVPGTDAATREISEALRSGKHTTTDARLYNLPGTAGQLIDTPGFQEFGLAHLTPGEIERAFPDMRSLLGQCRFYNCTHLSEPGCAIRAAVEDGRISRARYALFGTLTRASVAAAAPHAQ
jgi:ribosome biogenesis GTPase